MLNLPVCNHGTQFVGRRQTRLLKNKERNDEIVKELMKKIGKHFLEAAEAYYQMTRY
jgi:hypothetical protein